MQKLPIVALFLVLVCLLALFFVYVAQKLPVSAGYEVTCTFRKLPENDIALETWLKQQPGIVPHTVHIRRNDADKMTVTFILSRSLWQQFFLTPPFPNLEAAVDSIPGYERKTAEDKFIDTHLPK
jgi:hypothetical protein